MPIKYSIIIPHYNSEESLKRLLKSIPKKNYIQVIVVDDRSSSELFKKIITESHITNISCYINNGIKGAGSSRNIGLEKCKGKFIIFADADDFFTENAFLKIENSINNTNIDADIFHFKVISQINNSSKTGSRHIKYSTLIKNHIERVGKYYDEKIRLTHNVPWGKVFKADFLKLNNIKFDEVIVSNDVMFSTKAGKFANTIASFNEEIYCVTESDNTLTTKKSLKNFWIRLEIYANYYNFLTKEERKKISASPLPFLLKSIGYGPLQFFKAILFLKRKDVAIFKNLKIDKDKIFRFWKELSK